MKGFEYPYGGGGYIMYRSHCLIKTDSHYILYRMHNLNTNLVNNGEAVFFDKEFNYITSRRLLQPGFSGSVQFSASMINISAVKGDGDIAYLSTQSINVECPNSYIYGDCRLYEFDINLNNSDDLLPINKYIVRGTSSTEDYQASNNATIIREDNSLVFVYNMDTDDYKGDSWIVIENLDRDFNTISTMYYSTDHDGLCHEANSVIYTKDDGILFIIQKLKSTFFQIKKYTFNKRRD